MFWTVPLSIIRKFFHCTHSNGVCHTVLLTACEQDQDGTRFRPDPARKLYDVYHCCVYSEKLLMMDRGTVRKIQSFIPKINLRNQCIQLVLLQEFKFLHTVSPKHIFSHKFRQLSAISTSDVHINSCISLYMSHCHVIWEP